MKENIENVYSENSEWLDVSLTIYDRMVHWPDDPPVRINRITDLDRGDSHTLSSLSLGSHSGTHIDAPAHFIKYTDAVVRGCFEPGNKIICVNFISW